MLTEFYFETTPPSILLILMCVIFQNVFCDAFKTREEAQFIIDVNLSNSKQCFYFIITCTVILFTPILNVFISVVYLIIILRDTIESKKEED